MTDSVEKISELRMEIDELAFAVGQSFESLEDEIDEDVLEEAEYYLSLLGDSVRKATQLINQIQPSLEPDDEENE